MADTYTSSLRLQQPTIGGDAATWGGYLNTDLVLIDNAINGFATINIAGLSAFTLTVGNGVVDQARNHVYNFTGALSGDCTVTLPQSVKFGYAVNSTTGGHHVILTTGSGGTTLRLPAAAYYQFFFCDSSNVFSPSIGYAYANFQNDVAVNGALNVVGTTTLAGQLFGNAISGTTISGSTNVVCGSWFVDINGDQHIPYLNNNLSGVLNQSVTSSASPVFADVGISGLGFLKASFINQPVFTTSTPTFANVYLSYIGFLSNVLNQSVAVNSTPNFGNVYLGYFGDYLSNIVNQRVRTVDSPTFQDVHFNYLGLNASSVINQDVRSIASPTFANIGLSFVNGGTISAVLNQDVRSIASPRFNDLALTVLGGVNISAVLNQDVRTIASPTFVEVHQTSDIAYKDDIKTIGGALDKVLQIRGVSYTHKETGDARIGVIAQEMLGCFPETVRQGDDGKLAVNYGALVAPLIEAVKELATKVERIGDDLSDLRDEMGK